MSRHKRDHATLAPDHTVDPIFLFQYIVRGRWTTEYVFLTRADGDEWGEAKAHRYPDGWRVFCVCAKGDLIDVLASATEGGRYR